MSARLETARVESARLTTRRPVAYDTLEAWLDSNDLALGTPSTWVDRMGNHNATLVGSPVVSDGFGAGLRRMITLNGTSQYITADSLAALMTGSDRPISVTLVYRITGMAADYQALWGFHSSSAGNPKLEYIKWNQIGAAYYSIALGDGGPSASVAGGISTESPQVSVFSHTGTRINVWQNGVLTHRNAASDVDSRAVNLFTIGVLRRAGTPQFYMPMEVLELRVRSQPLSAAEQAIETAELRAKWGFPQPSLPRGGNGLWHVNYAAVNAGTVVSVDDVIRGRHLVQATVANRPTIDPTGGPSGGPALLFDGVNDVMTVAYTKAQPLARLAVVQCIDTAGTVLDGATVNTGRIYYTGGTFRVYAGAASVPLVSTTLTNWHVVGAALRGTTSYMTVDGTPTTEANAGSSAPSGMTLGSAGASYTDGAQMRLVCAVECAISRLAEWTEWANDGIF